MNVHLDGLARVRAGGWVVPTAVGVLTLIAVIASLVWMDPLGTGAPSSSSSVSADPSAVSVLLEDDGLPVEVTPQVERWIRHFLHDDPRGFEAVLTRKGLYGGMVRGKLRARGLPEELVYVAMIESGFSVSATSPSRAAGLWQFLGATARHYGLSVDGWVDERRDPVRATDAALDYLEELYTEFGSWYLAMAAYNASPARVMAALARAGVTVPLEGESTFWEVSRHLPKETQAYVARILAVALLAEHGVHFGFEVEPALPYLFDQVLVPPGTPLTRVASALSLPPSLLSDLNPHLIRGVTPPGRSFPVRIPQGSGFDVLAALSAS